MLVNGPMQNQAQPSSSGNCVQSSGLSLGGYRRKKFCRESDGSTLIRSVDAEIVVAWEEIGDHRDWMASPAQISASAEEDEWDTDGYVIPCLETEESHQNKANSSELEDSKPCEPKAEREANIEGDPTSQTQHQNQNSSGRKQRLKLKLKEADKRHGETERENKVESLQELMGSESMHAVASPDSSKEWLDPHCHESEFEKGSIN